MPEILEQIQYLNRHDLLAVAKEVMSRLEATEESDSWELSSAQEVELQRRLEEAERDNYAGDDWTTVEARIWSDSPSVITTDKSS